MHPQASRPFPSPLGLEGEGEGGGRGGGEANSRSFMAVWVKLALSFSSLFMSIGLLYEFIRVHQQTSRISKLCKQTFLCRWIKISVKYIMYSIVAPSLQYLYHSWYYYGASLRKFICEASASRMLINPGIVFTFTRQRWSSTTFSSYLALLVWRSNIRNVRNSSSCFLFSQQYRVIFSFSSKV
jgi:hypothetical protein